MKPAYGILFFIAGIASAGPIVVPAQWECPLVLRRLKQSVELPNVYPFAGKALSQTESEAQLQRLRAVLPYHPFPSGKKTTQTVLQPRTSDPTEANAALEKFTELQTRVKSPKPPQAYSIRGDDIEHFLSDIQRDLEKAQAAQKPYGLAEKIAVFWQRAQVFVEGGVGTAVGIAGIYFGEPIAYLGFAGTAAGLLAARKAKEIQLRETFPFLEAIDQMKAQLADGGQTKWSYTSSTYRKPSGVKSQAWERTRLYEQAPMRKPSRVDWFLDTTKPEPVLTLWIDETPP